MRKRSYAILLHLNEDEQARLNSLVEKSGYSRQAYLRSLIKGVVPADRPAPDYNAMLNELNAIGTSLNKIARKAHVLGVIDAARYDKEVCRLSSAVSKVDDAVRLPRRL